MKKIISISLMAALLACSRDKHPVTPQPAPLSHKPVSRPAGTPVGAKQTFAVTPAGGVFQSTDGQLKIMIPAGAVTANKVFEIQQVSNTCHGSIGNSFSITPHTTFAKPVAIQFSYAQIPHLVSIPDALGIAWQDAQGYWRLAKNAAVNKTDKHVTVLTDHFSNWTLLQWLQISPASAELEPGASAEMEVRFYLPLSSDDLLTPLAPKEGEDIAIGEGQPLPGHFIKSWAVAGPGTVAGNGSKATYHTPGAVQSTVTAMVTATLKDSKHQLLLVSNMTILADGLSFRIGGGAWQFLPGFAVESDDQINIAATDGERYFVIDWPGGKGNFLWERNIALVYTDAAGLHTTSHWFDKAEKRYIYSGGALSIDEFGAEGQYVTGYFVATGAGSFVDDDQEPTAKTTVEGYIKVKHVK
ncbi:hypothetical protein ACFOTA_09065 [Chitinophaga sp. GCM10012297]|uniref:ZU5 domain-containing protein n=1 Tax=Chitinophaga chungangae TaxID=2821488 RepID=A0ABS3YCF2_9BACT|nr:hypothetical protein [Chitinophaga chungangae]MBO9152354.1 hypothetical protein [Chitinophaga chungangae]